MKYLYKDDIIVCVKSLTIRPSSTIDNTGVNIKVGDRIILLAVHSSVGLNETFFKYNCEDNEIIYTCKLIVDFDFDFLRSKGSIIGLKGKSSPTIQITHSLASKNFICEEDWESYYRNLQIDKII